MLNQKDLYILEKLEGWLSADCNEMPLWVLEALGSLDHKEKLGLIRNALKNEYEETFSKIYKNYCCKEKLD